jgi:SAM-dependent methyltransferase
MFSKTAQYYDMIYSFKDYRAEAAHLVAITDQHLQSRDKRLLDVACGTGLHIEYLKGHFDAQGLDIDEEMLQIARQRSPEVTFHHGDMISFDLDQEFDVVTCLFSSIGYVKTMENLSRAVACMADHLAPGGLLIVEPWFTPDAWQPGTVHALFIDEPELKIARVNTSFAEGRLSFFELHYVIGTPQGTEHFVERHELGLFTTDEMEASLVSAGLDVTYDAEGLMGRGLYVGRRPE